MLQHLRIHRVLIQQVWSIICFAFVVQASQVSAQTPNPQRERISRLDTANLKKAEFKLTKNAHLEQYGFNDTARAVINLYFTKRKGTQVLAYSNLGFLAVIRAAGQEEKSPLDPSSEVSYKPWVIPALVVAGGVAVSSFVRLDVWSLKSLMKALYTYEKTGVLPDRLQSKLKPAHFK
jgi:hypothetical protein